MESHLADHETQQRHRLFFALLPDAPARLEIVRLTGLLRHVHRSYAEPIKPENLHVSLFAVDAYRGAAPDLIAGALAAGAAVKGAPFRICFDQTASFAAAANGKARPFVLFGEVPDGAVHVLRKAVAAAMRGHRLAYAVKGVTAFAPHVTLWWDQKVIAAHPVAPVSWTVRDVVLVDSVQGLGRHDHLARWPLGG